jgi:serine/threonine-protein kinase
VFCSRCGHTIAEGARFCPSCGLDLTATTPGARVTGQPLPEKSEAELVAEALASEYEILAEVGRGGMAIVYRARDLQLEREVAIKVLPFSLAFDAEFVERFQREARTAARLEHPHIIPIYRVGRSGRVIYFVMKLLRGQALSRVLVQRRALAPGEIALLLTQAGGALGFAHRHGIVHRDVKPDNIMFDELGHAMVTDFGIAKAASGTRLTGTGMSIGTPHYMSPEQARAQPLDGRSDLYSLGVVAYECLAGRKPFDGEDAYSIGYKHITEQLPEPALESADARRLFAVIRRMMEKDPADRYQSADDLVRELEGRRPSVTMLEMPRPPLDAESTAALTREEAAQVAATGKPGAAAVPPEPPVRRRSAPAETPATPDTPMPRRPAVRPPRRAYRKRSGGLVAAAAVLAIGAGSVGGYFVYARYRSVLDTKPPPAVQPAPTVDLGTVTRPPVDSALLAAHDSAARAATERARLLPDSGWLVVTGVPAGARLHIGEQSYRDTVLWLGLGTYKVRVSATGFADFDGSASVPKGDTGRLAVTMARAAAATPPASAAQPARRPATAARAPVRVPAGQCEDPRQSTYNANRMCWDTPPQLVGGSFITVDPGQTQDTRPVIVLVNVGSDGRAIDAFPVPRQGDDLRFLRVAVRHARAAQYHPATKGGQPVESFFQFRFAPQIRQ